MLRPSIPLLAFAAFLLVPVGLAQTPIGPTAHTNKVFVGYVFRPPAQINFSLYTHLCHAFITADADGILNTNRLVPNRQLVAEAHNHGVQVLLSLGGWGWDDQFAAITSDPAIEARYIQSVMQMVDDFDYDGIDLDWEYPDSPKEVEGFTRLATAFRQRLDALGGKKNRKMLQTIAASANPGTIKWLSNDLLLATMDWINLMTYDMAGDWTDYAGHHSPLHASSRQPGAPLSTELLIEHLLQRGMPADRIALGIPLYGRGFPVSEPYASTRDVPAGTRRPGVPGAPRIAHRFRDRDGWGLRRVL